MRKASGEPGWAWRRWIIFPVVIVSFGLLYLIIGGPDTEVNETVAWGLIVNIIMSVFIYTGFATAQDIAAIMATRSGLPYNPESSPAEPPPATDVTVEGDATVEVKPLAG